MCSELAHHARQIVLALDGSEHSQAGIRLIADLPLPPGSQLTALTVYSAGGPAVSIALQASFRQKVREIFKDRDLMIDTQVLEGHPAEALIDYADSHNPDLIVMGAKGLRATLGILLGGIAQQVVEYAHWPILVVRAPYKGLQRILFVNDGSIYAQQAEAFLGTFPLPEQVDLRVLHILPPPPSQDLLAQAWPLGPEMQVPMPPNLVAENQEWLAEEEKQGQAIVDRSIHMLNSKGLKQVTGEVCRGDAATVVLDYARENAIHLIVAGSRGLSRIRGWLLGSVSRKLVHYAECSVLIVKSDL
jgi:nucleotide-binding universal stress UspA family protein